MGKILLNIGLTMLFGITGFVLSFVFVMPMIEMLIPIVIVAQIAAVISTGLITFGLKRAVAAFSDA